jgi:hypothetical protein
MGALQFRLHTLVVGIALLALILAVVGLTAESLRLRALAEAHRQRAIRAELLVRQHQLREETMQYHAVRQLKAMQARLDAWEATSTAAGESSSPKP